MMKPTVLLIVFFVSILSVSAQIGKDSLLVQYMEEVKENISQNDFTAAEKSLEKVFSLKIVLPDEVAFYYGFIQVKLKNYVKGKEGLQKYIQLTEGAGPFYSETLTLLEEANENICKKCNNTGTAEVKDTCSVCKGEGKTEEVCNQCRINGMEICPTCHGKGVLVFKNSLGSSYSECSTCKGKGLTVCSQCAGTKKKKVFCAECKGIGFFKRKISCDHHKE